MPFKRTADTLLKFCTSTEEFMQYFKQLLSQLLMVSNAADEMPHQTADI